MKPDRTRLILVCNILISVSLLLILELASIRRENHRHLVTSSGAMLVGAVLDDAADRALVQ